MRLQVLVTKHSSVALALQSTVGTLVDSLTKLSQLDADIAQAEHELTGEEAANHPEKKRRIQERLDQQRDERVSCLEVASANHEQGVTIASVLTALGFIASTIVLAIQNVVGGGSTLIPDGLLDGDIGRVGRFSVFGVWFMPGLITAVATSISLL